MTKPSEVTVSDELARDLWEEHAAALCGGAENSDAAMEIAVARLLARAVAAEREASFIDGYNAGFMATGEGWNGEYPFGTLDECKADQYWLERRAAAIRART